MQELDQLPSPGPDLPGLRRLLNRVEVEPDVMDAAPGRPDDRVEVLEALDEEGLGGGGIVLAAAVGHRLPAAGLIERVLNRAAEPLEELERGDAHFREKGVDVTGDEEPNFNRHVPPRSQSANRRRVSIGHSAWISAVVWLLPCARRVVRRAVVRAVAPYAYGRTRSSIRLGRAVTPPFAQRDGGHGKGDRQRPEAAVDFEGDPGGWPATKPTTHGR